MPDDIDDATLEFLLARAGLVLSEAQKAELKAKDNGIADLERRLAALEKLIESNVRKGN